MGMAMGKVMVWWTPSQRLEAGVFVRRAHGPAWEWHSDTPCAARVISVVLLLRRLSYFLR